MSLQIYNIVAIFLRRGFGISYDKQALVRGEQLALFVRHTEGHQNTCNGNEWWRKHNV